MHPLALIAAALLRVVVDAPGTYEVPGAEIKRAGLEAKKCNLWIGTPTPTAVPVQVTPGGGIRFLAAARTRHSRETVYLLRPREDGEAAVTVRGGRWPAPAGYFRFEPNDLYDPLAAKQRAALEPFGYGAIDHFYAGRPAAAHEVRLEFPAFRARGSVAIEIGLQGARAVEASNGVDVVWNGVRVGGPIRWAGPRPHTAKVEVDAKSIKREGNTLRVEARDGAVRLDWVELKLDEAPLATSPRKPVRVEKAEPEDLRDGAADWLAISVDSCVEALAPLAAHRAAQGLRARVVRLRDVFDTFSAGSYDPRAIRRFLEHAAKAWKPAPRFVLLAGDATYDVESYAPPGAKGRTRGETLPAALVDTFDNGASASDNWFVAFGEGGGSVPELAIGRFPVSDGAAAARLVERTIAYETRAPMGPWRRKLSFVAGEGRFGPEIDRAIEDLALTIFNDYIPQGYSLDMTYASPMSPYLYVPEKLRDKVVERMNEGAAILNYTGHGARDGFDDLRFRGVRFPVFDSADVPRVRCPEGRRPIVLITACWTGCFDYPEEESVGELLFEHEGGPIAVFASSRISHPFSNAVLSKELVAGLFGKGGGGGDGAAGGAPGPERPPERLGEALVRAKRLVMRARDPYREMIAGYGMLFLGDPTLLVRLLEDDLHLYNLLGDPALLMPFPKEEVALEALGPAVPGEKLKVRGKAAAVGEGKALVTFEVERKTIRGELEPVDFDRPGYAERIARNYETANRKAVAEVEVAVKGGGFEAELRLPDDLFFTRHWLKAYCWNEKVDALGAVEVNVVDESE